MPKADQPEKPTVYRLELAADVNSAQFTLDGQEILLDENNRVFETQHQPTFVGLLRLHPFLKEA